MLVSAMQRGHDQSSESLVRQSGRRRVPRKPSLIVQGVGASKLPPAFDPLTDVLRMVKLKSALLFLVKATSPWGVNIPHASTYAPIILPVAQHVVSYHIVLEGKGWAGVGGEEPVRFSAGDVLVFPHADPYSIVSSPDLIRQPEASALDFFRDMAAGRTPFVVTEGGGGEERAKFICGFLGCDMRPFNPLFNSLPRLLHVKRAENCRGDLLQKLIDLMLSQSEVCGAGSLGVRLGLGELMFIEALRRHLVSLPAAERGWIAGLRDPQIGRALSALHQRPAEKWSVGRLARETGISRSVLAERFPMLVGMPPLHYLTRWRMQLAARQLSDGSTKVAAVAENVGYGSEAAFSRCFKKLTGFSPTGWRKAAGKQ